MQLEVERIRRWIEVLTDVEANDSNDKCFSIASWARPTTCGVAACAGGWAALDPVLREQGLMLNSNCSRSGYPVFGVYSRYIALAMFFGIEYDHLHWICNPRYYAFANVRAGHVIPRLEALLNGDVGDVTAYPLTCEIHVEATSQGN